MKYNKLLITLLTASSLLVACNSEEVEPIDSNIQESNTESDASLESEREMILNRAPFKRQNPDAEPTGQTVAENADFIQSEKEATQKKRESVKDQFEISENDTLKAEERGISVSEPEAMNIATYRFGVDKNDIENLNVDYQPEHEADNVNGNTELIPSLYHITFEVKDEVHFYSVNAQTGELYSFDVASDFD